MQVKIDYMREYITLSKTLNFTDAANLLYMTQPALSRHIALTEADIGAQLFIRTKHYVELTPMGEQVLKEFQSIIEQYDVLLGRVAQFNTGFAGELRIAMQHYASDTYMPALLDLFRSNFPDVRLLLQPLEHKEMIQSLLNESVDIGLTGNADSNIYYENIRFHNISRERLYLMISDTHPFAGMDSIEISKLANEILILSKADERFMDYTINILNRHKISPRTIVADERLDVLPFLLTENKASIIVPSHLKTINRKSIRFVEISNEDLYLDMALAYKSSNNNPAIPLFIQQAEHLFVCQSI